MTDEHFVPLKCDVVFEQQIKITHKNISNFNCYDYILTLKYVDV